MSENVQVVTDLPVKPSTLKVFAKRMTLTAVAVGVGAAIYLKVKSNDAETETAETPAA